MNIYFYSNYQKRENSTKAPLIADATRVLTGYLIEPCSIMFPKFKIERFASDAAPESFNYAAIIDFGRFYFVKDWIWNNGLWECNLVVDVLASFKTPIANSYAYIERASAMADGSGTFYNGEIIDRVYPATTNRNLESISLSAPWTGYDESWGCYILGVIGAVHSYTAGGAVSYYALTHGEMMSLTNYLLSNQFYVDAGFDTTLQPNQQISQNVAKCLFSPIQYIVSCMWFPCDVSKFSLSQNSVTINVGPFTTIATGKYITDRVSYRDSFNTGTLPVHPQSPTRGKYLNYYPYTAMQCMLPPFGSFPIDTAYIEIGDKLHFEVQVDGITGKANLQVGTVDSDGQTNIPYFYQTSAMFGVPIQLSQVTSDYLKMATSVVGMLGNAVGAIGQAYTGNFIGAAHSGLMALQSVGNAIDAQMPQAVSEGVNGSFTAFDRLTGNIPRLTIKHQIVVDEDLQEQGRPLCEVKRIADLAGFIKCGDAHVDYPCFDEEKKKILSYMTSGFYYE